MTGTGIRRIVVLAVAFALASVGTAMAGQQRFSRLSDRITGTYQLQSNGGDDPQRAAELAARAAPSDQRQRTYQNLLTRLEAPELIAIERNQNSVTMASTRGQQVTFDADGRDRSERWSGDRSINTRATFEGDRLVVETTGNRGSDFTVTFDPSEDGRSLLVTRTIYDEDLRDPVTVRSFYRRTSDQARWNIDAGDGRSPYNTRSARGDVVVPDGTRFIVTLDNDLSTMNAREGDRWTMTARSPSQYKGAVIQGFVSSVNAPGRHAGSADMTLNLQSIRTPDGKTIRVDREGTLEDRSRRDDLQTQDPVERGAIGAVFGALIGAAAGGGKGAAIGAVIGGSVGAGTAIVEGRDRLDLQRGTELAITSGAPWTRQGIPTAQR